MEAARRVGYPVALKVANPEVVHKTDRGLVRIGVADDLAVAAAVADFAAEMGVVPTVLVQAMAKGVEVALGVVRDPSLGPLVMVAAGGVQTDVWDDRVFLVPPVTGADAARAVRSLRIWPLLDGFRGAPPADVASLEQILVDLGRLAADVREVAELDLNPAMVGGARLRRGRHQAPARRPRRPRPGRPTSAPSARLSRPAVTQTRSGRDKPCLSHRPLGVGSAGALHDRQQQDGVLDGAHGVPLRWDGQQLTGGQVTPSLADVEPHLSAEDVQRRLAGAVVLGQLVTGQQGDDGLAQDVALPQEDVVGGPA